MESIQIQQITTSLLQNQTFISQLHQKLNVSSQSTNKKQNYQAIIDELQIILLQLIRKALQQQMLQLIEDNNNILNQMRQNIVMLQGKPSLPQFSDFHRLINSEKKNPFEESAIELDKSVSVIYDKMEERLGLVEKKLKNMEDKYETNFKSLWNVLSTTEAAIFDHISQRTEKQKQIQQPQLDKKRQSFFNMKIWK